MWNAPPCAAADPPELARPSFVSNAFTRIRGQWPPLAMVWLIAPAFCLLPALMAQEQRESGGADPRWEILKGCRLLTNAVVDGDSFRVLHKDRECIFRLYFVDAPETDRSLRERTADQAAYFGIAPASIPEAARLASQFTRERLTEKNFTVLTRWQSARGRSSPTQFYAVVIMNGENLAEELVGHGLARIYGLRANWPDGPRSATFINQLKNLELAARQEKRGVWDENRFPRVTGIGVDSPGPKKARPGSQPLDVNSASLEELETLPGIGPKLAERIIAHRPYRTVEELIRVPGIGEKTVGRLKPLVRAESLAP